MFRQHLAIIHSKVLQHQEAAVPQRCCNATLIGCVMSGVRVRILLRTHRTVTKYYYPNIGRIVEPTMNLEAAAGQYLHW